MFSKKSKPNGHKKWTKKPLVGLWSKEKVKKSTSVANVSMIGHEDYDKSRKDNESQPSKLLRKNQGSIL